MKLHFGHFRKPPEPLLFDEDGHPEDFPIPDQPLGPVSERRHKPGGQFDQEAREQKRMHQMGRGDGGSKGGGGKGGYYGRHSERSDEGKKGKGKEGKSKGKGKGRQS